MLCMGLSSFAQDAPGNEQKINQSFFQLDKGTYSLGNCTFDRSDTLYYEDGTIKTVSVYPKTSARFTANAISNFELQKKVFQYDRCGNLRNIAEVTRYTGPIESCHDYYFNHPYQIREKLMVFVNCEESWTKPLLIY